MPTLERVKKYLNYLFLDTTPAGESPTWKRATKSTDLAIAMNAETETFDFIADESPTDEIKNYKPSISQTQTAYIGDPVYDYIFDLYNKQGIGSDAVTKAMIVYQQTKTVGSATKNIALQFDALITIDTYEIVAGTITYTIGQRGTPTHGTATIAEGVPTFEMEVEVGG